MFGLFPPKLGKLQARKESQGLLAALKYQYDSQIRAEAATALGNLGATDATEALIQAMKDYDAAVRQAAVKALDQLGWQPNSDEERGLSIIARQQWTEAKGLGKEAVPHFLRVLYDQSDRVRRNAESALIQIGAPAAEILAEEISQSVLVETDTGLAISVPAKTYQDRMINLLVRIGEPAVAPLITKLLQTTETCDSLGIALGKIGSPALTQLLEILQADNAHARAVAIIALRTIKDPTTLEPIVLALQDTSAKVRAEAVLALGEFGNENHLGVLEGCLKDRDRYVREQAQSAFSKLKSRLARKP